MEIQSTYTKSSGEIIKTFYNEEDPLKNLDEKILKTIHAFCFYNNKLIIVYAKKGKYWNPPGGGIEPGESFEQAVIREVHEETNMKVLHQELIGYQDFYESNCIIRQTRSVCIVEPFGSFISDPDGDITEIKLINPSDYKKYFDWGKVGDRMMERAIELKNNIKFN